MLFFFILVAATDIYYETSKILTPSSLESNILNYLITIKADQLRRMKFIILVVHYEEDPRHTASANWAQ
jgi:hypothetical protein